MDFVWAGMRVCVYVRVWCRRECNANTMIWQKHRLNAPSIVEYFMAGLYTCVIV